jgi:retinol-binding protein 3
MLRLRSSLSFALAIGCAQTSAPASDAAPAGAPAGLEGAAPAGTAATTAAVPAPVDIPLEPMVCREVLQTLATRLRAEYVFPKTGDEMARMLDGWLDSGVCDAVRATRELTTLLTTELQALSRDKHLRVFNRDLPPLPSDAPVAGAPPEPVVGGIRKREILEGNIGYIETTAVPGLEEARGPISAAFEFLANTDALILDLRANTGGDPMTVALYVSYLSEGPPFLVNTFQWRNRPAIEEFFTTDLGARSYGKDKPVYVLTSATTFSGGEELAYDLQALKRGVLVGETTGGGANPGGPRPLGHGFVVGIPMGRAVNPITHTNWEGTGVKPDIQVPASEALATAHRAALAGRKPKDTSAPR